MLKNIISIITAASIFLLIVLLNITAPVSASPLMILFIFILTYLSSLGITAYIIYGFSYIISHTSTIFATKKPIERISFKRSYYYSTIIAAVPVMLVGLQSVGAIGIYEFFLVLFFALVGCLYVSKRIH